MPLTCFVLSGLWGFWAGQSLPLNQHLHLPSIDPQGELQRDPRFPVCAECGTLEDNVERGWGGTQIPMSATGGTSVKCQCPKHPAQPLTNLDILEQSLFFSCLSFLIRKMGIHSSACTKGHP